LDIKFSIIVPVYNRPKEIDELLLSLTEQEFKDDFEVLIVEDGSTNTSKLVIDKYASKLTITYLLKLNSGPGASRNYGMQRATGNYFIILDSDVIVPRNYLLEVKNTLFENYTDAFGGPDKAHKSFTILQKAINYSMTSVLTTGGIRGKKKAVSKFQPRSFNLGVSKKAFEATQGFSNMRAGEDIDFTFRLWKLNFETQLIENAYVYHKRRTDLKQFFNQTFAFGTARPVLNKKYPSTKKLTYWFPSLFILGLVISMFLFLRDYHFFLEFYALYFIAIFVDSCIQNKSFTVGFYSVFSTITQFFGYGLGFFKSYFKA